MKRILDFAPLKIRLPRLPSASFPLLGIDATINGASACIQRTLSLAYFEPIAYHRQPAARVADVDLDGRDPNW